MASRIVPAEKDIQAACLELLRRHHKIAWVFRLNTGAMKKQYTDKSGETREHFVRFAFKGCSDIIGQLTDGRFLALEVKRPGRKPSADQQAFIDAVNTSNGVGWWVDDVTKLKDLLDSL